MIHGLKRKGRRKDTKTLKRKGEFLAVWLESEWIPVQ
jgi:hypothetical protein